MQERTSNDLVKSVRAVDAIASALTYGDPSSLTNQVSKFAFLVPIHNTFRLRKDGTITDEAYRAIFDECWRCVSDRSGCAEDLDVMDDLIDILTTLGMVPEDYVFEYRGGGLGRWF